MAQEKSFAIGECVFATWNGLEIDATGLAAGLKVNTACVEFDQSELGGIDYLPRGKSPSIFLRKLRLNAGEAVLLGQVDRSTDANGRQGFFGAAVLVSDASRITVELAVEVNALFVDFERFMQSVHANAAHAKKLKYFSNSGQGRASLDVWRAGPPKVHVNPETIVDTSFFQGVAKYLNAIDDQTATVLIGLDEDSRYQPLTSEIIKAQSQIRKDAEAKRLEQERQRRKQFSSKAKANFDRRTPLLKSPRPPEVTPDFEQYLVEVIQYVVRSMLNKEGKSSQNTGAIKSTDLEPKVKDAVFGMFRSKK